MFEGTPGGWERISLEDVADISRGTSWRDENEAEPETDGALPVLGIRNVQANLNLTDVTWLKALPPSAVRSSTVECGDILMVGSNGNPARIGNAVRVDEPGRFLYASLLFGLRPRKQIVDDEFLFHLIRSASVQEAISETVQGTTGLSNLKISTLRDLAIALPSLDEQRRIAEVLRSVDEAVKSQSAVRDQLAKTFDQLVEACFVEANEPRVPLGEVCQSIQVGIVIRPASYYVASGGIPALRSLNVGENRLNLDDLVYISEDGHRRNGKSSLRPGDVVTRRSGEPGKSAMIPTMFDSGLNCIDIIFSRPKNELRSLFLSFFMNSDAAKRQVSAMQGGLAQQHLNVSEMKKLKVPLPPLARQDEVIAILSDAWDHLEMEREAVRRLSSMRNGLASDLLSGRVRVLI